MFRRLRRNKLLIKVSRAFTLNQAEVLSFPSEKSLLLLSLACFLPMTTLHEPFFRRNRKIDSFTCKNSEKEKWKHCGKGIGESLKSQYVFCALKSSAHHVIYKPNPFDKFVVAGEWFAPTEEFSKSFLCEGRKCMEGCSLTFGNVLRFTKF